MATKNGIKYLLIGAIDSVQILTEFTTSTSTKQNQNESKQIFEKICKNPDKKFDERNKITSKGSNYFFILIAPNLFFLILSEADYPERLIFQMIDAINQDHIPLMVNNDKNELNPQGRQALKQIVDKYQDPKNMSKISEINSEVEALKVDMKKNIKDIISTAEDVQELEGKSNALKATASDYKQNAKELQRVTWLKNVKLWIIIGVIVVALILIIVLPIVL